MPEKQKTFCAGKRYADEVISTPSGIAGNLSVTEK